MVTVVITGADHPTGLGTARCLKGLGCEIIGLYSNKKSFCCSSNCWDKLVFYEGILGIYDVLISVGRSVDEKIVLFPTQDNVVKLISDNRGELQEYYDFLLPGKKQVDLLLDKTKFQIWAEKHGFRVPSSVICRSLEEFKHAIEKIGFPLIVKPFEKTVKWDHFSPRDKILKLNSRMEVDSIDFDLFEAANTLLVQQWIPGDDANVYFCLVCYDKNGALVEKFTGRKLLQAPPYCGSTAAAVGVDEPEVDDITMRLFNLVGYRGLGSLELKKSDKDMKYYLVEPTVGRNDLQSNLALSGGVNLTQLALSELASVQPPERKFRKGVWINEEGLIDSIRFYLKKRDLEFALLLKLFSRYNHYAILSISDTKPFREWFSGKIKRFGKKCLRLGQR